MLVGCGGGSGGGGDAGPDPDGPVSLIPAAPALGEVLVADALSLRPLRGGSRWMYREELAGATTLRTTVDVSGSSPTFTEVSAGAAGGGERTLSVSGSTLSASEVLDLGDGTPTSQVNYTVLRSPVRSGDQFTLVERNDLSAGTDLDGDGIEERLDLAAYSRVVGWEDIDLPALGRRARTVRVDTFFLVRVFGTRADRYEPTARVRETVWYWPGVGVARMQTTAGASDGGDGVVDSDLTLTSWDGVTTGVGFLDLGGRPFGAPPLGWPLDGVSLGDRAVVLHASGASADAISGVWTSVVNARGDIVRAQQIPALSTFGTTKLARLSDSTVGLLWSYRASAGSSDEIRMIRLDRDGVPLDTYPGLRLVDTGIVGAATMAAAWDGQRMWLAWVRFDATAQQSESIPVVVQSFDATGLPSGPLTRIGASPNGGALSLGLAPTTDGVMASWWQSTSFGEQRSGQLRVARVNSSGAVTSTVVADAVSASFSSVNSSRLAPFALSDGSSVLFWGSPLFGPAAFGTGLVPRALSLDAALTPRWGGLLQPDEHRLPLSALPDGPTALAAQVGNTLVVAQTSYTRTNDPQLTDFLRVSFAPMTGLPARDESFISMQLPTRPPGTTTTFGSAAVAVALADRVVLLGYGNQEGAKTLVAWPR
jgi:hypothetical protein